MTDSINSATKAPRLDANATQLLRKPVIGMLGILKAGGAIDARLTHHIPLAVSLPRSTPQIKFAVT